MARGGRAGVEVEGAKELRRAFDRMEDRAGDLRELHKDAASIVEREAESLVPVLTGRLRDSIRTTAGKTSAAVLAGKRLIPYAGPIHFGWREHNIEPQPFLYDALDSRRDEVADRYARGVEKLVHQFDTEAPD